MKVWVVLSPSGVASSQFVGFVLSTMEANNFTWQFASIIAPFQNRVSVSGNTFSFKLKSITCYPTSEEKKIVPVKQLDSLLLSTSSWLDIFQLDSLYQNAILTHLLTATNSSDPPQKNWLLLIRLKHKLTELQDISN